MKVTANIDVNTPTGRRLVRELEKHNKVVKITYPESEETPEGYMTSDEFRKSANDKVKKFCEDNGIVPEGYMTSEEFRAKSKSDLDEIFRKHGVLC